MLLFSGYLACTLLLKETDELILLLINTIIKDLNSKNIVEMNIALSSVVYLTPAEMSPMILPILLEKLTHSKDFIRKKALICLQQLIIKNPDIGVQFGLRIHQCLSDPDPGVVAIAVQVARTICEQSQDCDFKLIPTLTSILEQILSNRLPSEYTRKGIPAPWFQIDILKLLSVIVAKGKWDPEVYESLSAVVINVMDSANPKETSGQAIIMECVQIISNMNRLESDAVRTNKALQFIRRFIQSKHNDVKYIGLSALEIIFKHSPPKLGPEEEESVLNCLSHFDVTIQRKTLSLLYVLASKDNVRKICDKLVEYIKDSEDDFQREDLIEKVLDLANSFSIGLDWNVSVLLKLLQSSTGNQREKLLTKLKNAVKIRNEDSKQVLTEKKKVGLKLTVILKKICSSEKPPPPALRLYVWSLTENFNSDEEIDVAKAVDEICKIGQTCDGSNADVWQPVLVSCLHSLFNLLSKINSNPTESLKEFLKKCQSEPNSLEVQDLAEEILHLIPFSKEIQESLNSFDIGPVNVQDYTMTYLDEHVSKSLRLRPTVPYIHRPKIIKSMDSSDLSNLRFTPYQVLEEKDRWIDDLDSDDE